MRWARHRQSKMIDFSGIPRRGLHGRILRLPLRLIPRNFTMRVLQGRLRGKRWIVGSFNHGCWLGSYEFAKQNLIAETVEEGSVFFDIGAHVGFYTLLGSSLVGDKGKVFAFEPLPRNIAYLERHLQLNGVTNTTLFKAAVSDRSGTARFSEESGHSLGMLGDDGALTVDVVSLDELLASGAILPPDTMKIDVERAELAVLQGARRILTEACPAIFLTTHGSHLRRQCVAYLESLGYRCRPVTEGRELGLHAELLATKTNRRP